MLSAAMLYCAPALRADDASKAAKIDEMLTLLKADQMLKQMLEQIKIEKIA